LKIWCPLCRKKVEVTNFTERIVPVNHGSRKQVEGTDSKGHRVSTFASMKVTPVSVSKKVVSRPVRKKRKVRRDIFGVPY
jgi:hypothetical protein